MELLTKKCKQEDQNQKELVQYHTKVVNPIFTNLMTNIIKSKPQDILQFCTKWFKDKKGVFQTRQQNSQQQGNNLAEVEILPDQVFRQWRLQKLQKARKRRIGFSSQKSCRGSIKVQNGEKKQQHTYMRILFFCMNSFLFKNFTQKQIGELIQKMRKQKYDSDKQICTQGQYGDRMYFVDQGIFQCIQYSQQGAKSLKYFHVGDTFGQICLLHMIKRQASVFSRSQGTLYSLDRQSYIHFKKMCMIKKRALYYCTLRNQQFFSTFNQQELQKVCDVLIEVTYEEGQIVINEGDVGSKFYIIIDGILVAFKGNQSNIIQCYKEGDAFGEIALIKDKPRQASVKALTRSRLVYMTRDVFCRIFQNVNLEKQIDEKYANKGNLIHKRRPQNQQIKAQKEQISINAPKRTSIRVDRQAINNFQDTNLL